MKVDNIENLKVEKTFKIEEMYFNSVCSCSESSRRLGITAQDILCKLSEMGTKNPEKDWEVNLQPPDKPKLFWYVRKLDFMVF